MKRHSTLITATLLALALPLAAGAATQGQNFLDTWDYDGDGTVTLAEILERRGDLFAGFDADENGVLSPEELATHDDTRDGMRSNEARGHGQEMAQTGRGPGWGRNDRAEPGMDRGRGQGRFAGQGFGRGPGNPRPQQPAQQMAGLGLDLDGDGRVTEAEFVAAGTGWFARFDRDGDGTVTEDDFGQPRR